METAAIEKYAVGARVALMEGVRLRAAAYELFGPDAAPADAISVRGHALTAAEQQQRRELLDRIAAEPGKDASEREEAFTEEMAYTWFNRLFAIRYMEVHDYLPSRTRILSDAEGRFRPQALTEAASLDLEGLDTQRVLELKAAGDDEPLFREILLAQCDELAGCLPDVFEPLGAADALMLPDNLLAPDSVVAKLVEDLPETWQAAGPAADPNDDPLWGKVEIIGWAYQFYISEKKAQVFAGFKKSRKAETVSEIGPATQLFTPEWIVRYMVENSLGRLWMLNNPQSGLREQMRYYIEPEGETEDFIHVQGPEEITLLDPACGSGHILVYAFDLLAAMYEDHGYRPADIAQLILEKNLSGLEIDRRATQLASLALSMKARELDRRFFRRGVRPDVHTLESVTFTEDELEQMPALGEHPEDVDVLAYLSEVGSLLVPSDELAGCLRDDLATIPENMLTHGLRVKLQRALGACEALSRKFAVVAANPPYMGSSNFGPWMSKWTKKTYPNTKSDLFACSYERYCQFALPGGELGFMTPYVWMFIGSYEKMRRDVIGNRSITSLVQLEYSGFAGATVPICTFTLTNQHVDGLRGGYIRLADFPGPAVQGPKTLEAIQNPTCSYFYRADATNFNSIPGTPIAYWASEAFFDAFTKGDPLRNYVTMPYGFKTGNNDRFLRLWWEVSACKQCVNACSRENSIASGRKWFPYNKGGQFRRWYGNREFLLDYEQGGISVIEGAKANGRSAADYNHSLMFKPVVTWSRISSGKLSMRYVPSGSINDMTGPGYYGEDDVLGFLCALCNSSTISSLSELLSPTLDFQPGQIGSYPVIGISTSEASSVDVVLAFVKDCIGCSRCDCALSEMSWSFRRCELI